uniref:Secreted protein n=1 Tax=Triticum urartu TaxID=4572 RepID=A0A8R7QV07_TRIUA
MSLLRGGRSSSLIFSMSSYTLALALLTPCSLRCTPHLAHMYFLHLKGYLACLNSVQTRSPFSLAEILLLLALRSPSSSAESLHLSALCSPLSPANSLLLSVSCSPPSPAESLLLPAMCSPSSPVESLLLPAMWSPSSPAETLLLEALCSSRSTPHLAHMYLLHLKGYMACLNSVQMRRPSPPAESLLRRITTRSGLPLLVDILSLCTL